MFKEDELIGAINILRQEVRPFTNKQIELAQNFAAQAVIAIENTRLLNELRQRTDDLSEALEHQTATGEILASISGSVTDTKPVFDVIVQNLRRLFGTRVAMVQVLKDGMAHLAAAAQDAEFDTLNRQFPRPVDGSTGSGRAMLSKQVLQLAPVLDNPAAPPATQQFSRDLGFNSAIFAPMIREDRVIGVIGTARRSAEPFDDKQIALVQNFAAQAVIAIENTRLLNELRESLQQQTATADVLKVISRSTFDLQAVLDTLAESAVRLCEADQSVIRRHVGDAYSVAATYGFSPQQREHLERYPTKPDRGSTFGRAITEGRTVHIPDVVADQEFQRHDQPRATGIRAAVSVPLVREGEIIGALTVIRTEPCAFSQKQIELLETFADQAVIAIENARLFAAEQQRRRELAEALDQQTATSEVMQVISSSTGELQPVFQAMLENATRICEAKIGILFRYENGAYSAVAMLGVTPAYAEWLGRGPIRPGPTTGLGRVADTRQTIHIVDTQAEQVYAEREPLRVATAELGGARTLLNVPMVKEGELIGALGIYRQEIRPFTDKQIALVTNFAHQAVIAIENARLLNELRQRTDDLTEALEQQTATSEVLRVISSSAGELEPVFQAMLENATRICGANFGTLSLYEGDEFRNVARYNLPPAFAAAPPTRGFRPHPESGLGEIVRTKRVVHIENIRALPLYSGGDPVATSFAELTGARTLLIAPMLKENRLIGTIGIFRQEVKSFTSKQIELLTNFEIGRA